MKKYILSLCTLLSIGQCYSMQNAQTQDAQMHQAISNLYNIIAKTDIKRASQDLFIAWNQTISSVTAYAINKSKNALGQQDMSLITTATLIRDINNEIITLYKALQQDLLSGKIKTNITEIERQYYEHRVATLKGKLAKENTNLTTSHRSISKQEAQSVLRETVKYLNVILDIIKDKAEDIPIKLR